MITCKTCNRIIWFSYVGESNRADSDRTSRSHFARHNIDWSRNKLNGVNESVMQKM